MIDPVNQYENHIAARLLEYFDARTPWHRALWNIGLVMSLHELLEASQAAQASILSSNSLDSVAKCCLRLIESEREVYDPGAGFKDERRTLQQAISSTGARNQLRFEGQDYRVIEQLTVAIESQYLDRWRVALGTVPANIRPERAARAIASHMLDSGFSLSYLHRWWSYRIYHRPGVTPLSQLVAEAAELIRSARKQFEVLVLQSRLLAVFPATSSAVRWMNGSEASAWIREQGFDTRNLVQHGGILFNLEAFDPEAAVDYATEILENFNARLSLSQGRGITAKKAWVRGHPKPFDVKSAYRGVRVEALSREGQIFSGGSSDRVDAAIQLLSALQSSSPSAAIGGGWAAIEALLSEPEDRGGAAERLANIVACSFIRAELTALAWAIVRENQTLASDLSSQNLTNQQRSLMVGNAISRGESLGLASPSDLAAEARMKVLIGKPAIKLADIQVHASDAFRRLYRQRNLVLHGGKTDAVALRATLRTTAPLVGAGMDRIVHARYVDNLNPLELAARAKIALGTIGSGGVDKLVKLLG